MNLAIVNIGELVTLRGPNRPRSGRDMSELQIILDATVQITNDRISYAGPSSRAPATADTADEFDAGGRVVLPGFVDAHTHLVWAGSRVDEFERRIRGETYEQIAASGGGIRSTMRATREASDMELLTFAHRRLDLAIRNGTTALEIKSGYGLSERAERKMLRVIGWLRDAGKVKIATTFLGAHAIPPEFDDNPDGYVDLLCNEMLPQIATEKLADFVDIFIERGAFTPIQATKYLMAAQKLGLKMRAHVDQLGRNHGAELAAGLGCTVLDHLEHTDAAGIKSIATKGVQPVLLPGSVYALGRTKYADGRAMIDAGLAVVLATDFNPGSSPTLAMPMVLSLACTHMRMSPAEAITAATFNAACCLGWNDEIGSIEEGKRADLVVHDCADHRELGYYFGQETARVVVAGGKVLYHRQ